MYYNELWDEMTPSISVLQSFAKDVLRESKEIIRYFGGGRGKGGKVLIWFYGRLIYNTSHFSIETTHKKVWRKGKFCIWFCQLK